MSLIDQIEDWSNARRAELVDLIEYLKGEREHGVASWQGFDSQGKPVVKKNGKTTVVKAGGNTGIKKNSQVYKDETNTADWQSRKKEKEVKKTKISSKLNKEKQNLFYRADDQILLTTPGVGIIRYLPIDYYGSNNRSLRGRVANTSSSQSISFYDTGVYSADNSRNCLASTVFGEQGFPGTSHSADVSTPSVSISGDPTSIGTVNSGLSFGPGAGSLSLSASGMFTAETYGSIEAVERLIHGDLIEYISTPGGVVQIKASDHVDFYVYQSFLYRSSLVDDILFLTYWIRGFDDTVTTYRSSGSWEAAVGKAKEGILQVRVDTTDGTAQYIYNDMYSLKGSWWLGPYDPATDSFGDFFYFGGLESTDLSFEFVRCVPLGAIVSKSYPVDILQAICETAFPDDWIAILGGSECMNDLETSTLLQRAYFSSFITGTYRQDSSIYFYGLAKDIPEAQDYADYGTYLADVDTNYYRTISTVLDSTTTLTDVISLVSAIDSQDKQSLEPLVSFEEFDQYVVGNDLSVGPAVTMNLPQLPEGAVLDKAVNSGYADNLGTFQVIFPAVA